jgi:hypothetical protein
VKIVLVTLVLLLAGALVGAGVGWLVNPKAVALPDESLGFVNYVGPILGGALGGTFGLIFGGGFYAGMVARREAKGG